MEISDLYKSLCEEILGGEMDSFSRTKKNMHFLLGKEFKRCSMSWRCFAMTWRTRIATTIPLNTSWEAGWCDLRKKKVKKPTRTPERLRRPRQETVLIKPAEEMSYASILCELKKRVNPDKLGATVEGIREMRSKDLLVKLKCSTKSRGRLDIAFKEATGDRETSSGSP